MRIAATLLALAACGNNDPSSVHLLDAPFMCPISSLCNPLAQLGCHPDERCAVVLDTSPCPVAVSCVAIGPVPIGGTCRFSQATEDVLADNCGTGAMCVQGTCRQICDPFGGMPTCMGLELCEAGPAFSYVGSCSL